MGEKISKTFFCTNLAAAGGLVQGSAVGCLQRNGEAGAEQHVHDGPVSVAAGRVQRRRCVQTRARR